jgi:hypothetical protein
LDVAHPRLFNVTKLSLFSRRIESQKKPISSDDSKWNSNSLYPPDLADRPSLAGGYPHASQRSAHAGAAAPRGNSLGEIKHVVILMQENRSFDRYFGTLAGVRGFDDLDALKLPNGQPVFCQPDAENPKGYLLPFHLDTNAGSAQKIPSTSHA